MNIALHSLDEKGLPCNYSVPLQRQGRTYHACCEQSHV